MTPTDPYFLQGRKLNRKRIREWAAKGRYVGQADLFDKESKLLICLALEAHLHELNPVKNFDAVLAAKGNEEQKEAAKKSDQDFDRLYQIYWHFGGRLARDEFSPP